ncbi:hypothetical protein BGZ79_008923 [Entomortierella chlamydospora]|nr:hypothetical protein BGZ79_008923 [Entomortierella chlamydospora]
MAFINTSQSSLNGFLCKKTSPFDIPELQRIIFSFMTPRTVQVCLSVCRQWYNVAKPYLLTQEPVIWRGDPEQKVEYQQQLSRHLSLTRAIVIQKPSPYSLNNYRNVPPEGSKQWFDLLGQLEKMVAENRLQVNNLSVIRALKVETQLLPLLNITGPLLTTLTVENMKHPHVPLDRILVLCPRLRALHVKTTGAACYQTSYPHRSRPEHERPLLPNKLPLRSLTLEYMGIEEAAIMRLLSSCPDLEELQLLSPSDLNPKNIFNRVIDSSYPPLKELVMFIEDSFLREIALRCPDLKKVYFSYFSNRTWRTSCLTFFPKVTHWIIPRLLVDYQILRSLKSFGIMLTTLEIVGWAAFDGIFASHLHQFMCESPQLLHLIAPSIGFDTVWFDLEGILDTSESLHSKHNGHWDPEVVGNAIEPFHRKIWSCRGLRTLRLTFRSRDEDTGKAEGARIIFGYIARVCPRLQDLSINCQELDLSLGGGFCLLSKLHDLRRLEISTHAKYLTGPWNVDWVVEYLSPALRGLMKRCISNHKRKSRKPIYAKHPFISNKDLHPLPPSAIQHLDIHTFGLDSWIHSDDNNLSASPTEQDIGPPCDPEWMIGGLDMRNTGHKKDMVELFEERLSKN